MDANGRAAARTAASDYVVTESPLGTARKLRVLMVGAGASGLNLARHMDLHMENFELTIYEKNSDVGGTWFENSYSEWDEILEYFRGIAQKYELYSNWKWPDVPGLHSFKGDLFHSAAWDPEFQVAEKTVAVLGTGSSGIQIVATLQPLTEEQKTNFKENPDVYMKYRKEIEGELNSRFRFVIADSADQKEAREYSSNEMRVKLKDEDILNYLMPKNFAVGCRRPTPGNGYLEALTKDNVRVVTNDVEKIVPDGIRLTNGEIIPVDTLICATGFDLSFCPRFKLIGRDGESIDEKWKDVPEAYLSVAVPGFPNYFSEPSVSIGGLVRCD
ncbi:FAD-binding monooxygenase [Colletotrichum sp. SAR 10_96]|nr:FAD-binding monooxygenase [Colletotrichum sp. SAR 10_96]